MADDTSPIQNARDYTPSDTNRVIDITYERAPRGVWVGGTGNVALQMEDGTNQTFVSVPVGILPVRNYQKILSTGTTATDLKVLW